MAITLDRPEVRGTAIYRSIHRQRTWKTRVTAGSLTRKRHEMLRKMWRLCERKSNTLLLTGRRIPVVEIVLQSGFRRSSLVMREEAGKGRAGPAAITNTLCEISLPRGFQVSLVPGFAPRNAIHAETWKRQSRPRVIPSGFSSSRLAVATLS